MKTGLLIGLLSFAIPIALQAEVVKVEQHKGETRKVEPFDKIELKIPATVNVHAGSEQSVVIEGTDKDLEQIQLKVVKEKLTITPKKNAKFSKDLDIMISVEKLMSVSVDGPGDINVKNLNNQSFTVSVDGPGNVRVQGSSDTLTVSLDGPADFFGFDCTVENATVSIDGPGDARINATVTLTATINGPGDVHYKGSPKVTAITNGPGSVQKSD